LGTTEKKVSKTALSTNVKSFERTDVLGDHENFNFDRTVSFSLSTSAFLTHIQPKYNQSAIYLIKPQKLQIHKISNIKDLKNSQKMMNVLNIRLQLD